MTIIQRIQNKHLNNLLRSTQLSPTMQPHQPEPVNSLHTYHQLCPTMQQTSDNSSQKHSKTPTQNTH